jgi:hypothetical protein
MQEKPIKQTKAPYKNLVIYGQIGHVTQVLYGELPRNLEK